MTEPLSIRIGGVEYRDCKSATVSYGIESFARSFSFEFSDKWTRSQIQDMPFVEGDPCEVFCHGVKVVDGFVDDIPISYDASSHSISVSGRSWNAHMVDCSAIHKTGSWRNVTLLDLADDLGAPFGVRAGFAPWLIDSGIFEPFPRWSIEEEETAYGCLQRAAEMRGVFLTCDAGRNIIITTAGPDLHPVVLRFGENIKSARRMGRFSERHSFYLVKSQRAGSDSYAQSHELVSGPFHLANDPGVKAYRPMVIVSDGNGSKAELARRAAWEMNTRAGRSRRISYNVVGLNSPLGDAWPPNERIVVDDPLLDTRDALLITSVSLSWGPGGEIASLELCRPEAFEILTPPKKPGKGFMSSW